MNKSKIYQLMKRSKQLYLWNKNNGQWISNGFAAYPLYGLPELTEESIKLVLGISDDKLNDYKVIVSEGCPDELTTDDTHGTPLTPVPLSINGYFTFVDDSNNYYFCNSAYLTPIAEDDIAPEYYLRESGDDKFIVAMQGWIIEALICEYKLYSTNKFDLAAALRGAAEAVRAFTK